MKAIVVGGVFNTNGGRPSKIIASLSEGLGWDSLNGGHLETIQNFDFTKYDTLFWAPDVDNAEDKILPRIKAINPKLLLISTKRVVEKEYTEADVIGRMLKSHSNLGVMMTRHEGRYAFRLLDPLGNQFCYTENVSDLAASLNKRVAEIKAMTRIGSVKNGDAVAGDIEPEFIQIVRSLGDIFSQHVNAVNPERFLGNASTRTTRCCHGFPSVRAQEEGLYFVSRRNVNKETMSAQDFVAVANDESVVRYYGDNKPSVDSPIQIRIFNHYANVNYMVHGHTYVDGAPSTHSIIPCGHIEEFNEIKELYPDTQASNFVVNLRGHGCLLLARDLEYLKTVRFKSRQFPELAL